MQSPHVFGGCVVSGFAGFWGWTGGLDEWVMAGYWPLSPLSFVLACLVTVYSVYRYAGAPDVLYHACRVSSLDLVPWMTLVLSCYVF